MLLATGALIAACSGDLLGGDGGDPDLVARRLLVHFVLPAASAPDPFADVTHFGVTLFAENGTAIESGSFAAGEPLSLPGLEAVEDVYLVLEGFDATDQLLSRGRTLLFDLTDSDADISMYFARVHTFNDVSGVYQPRAAPSVAVLSDGRVLLAGGIGPGSTLSTRTEIYDPVTDVIAASASLGTAIAFPAAVTVEDDVVLLAGGRNAAGDASRTAQVFVYDPATATGTWTPGVPRMSEAHTDAAAASLGASRGLVAGGEDAQGDPNDVTEIFTWSGGPGSWADGPVMSQDRLAPIGIGFGGGAALVGGGFRDNAGTIEAFGDCFAFNGTSFSALTAFDSERAWSGVVEIAPGDWLVFGGLDGALPGTPVLTTERLGWNGAVATHTPAADLPVARRRGGGGRLAHGDLLVIGGDESGHDAALAPIDSVLRYDPIADSFTPFGASPGATVSATVVPLPDGTTFVVTDGKATRYNPRP